MKKSAIYFLVFVMLMAVLTGCGSGDGDSGDASKGESAKDSIILAISADMASLDPLNSSLETDHYIWSGIFDTLVIDVDGEILPSLAKSWGISDDGLTYTFHLEEGVKFHNGEELKADDVVFSIKAAKESGYISGYVDQVSDAVAVDNYTVETILSSPNAAFLLALTKVPIENEKAVNEAGENFGQQPIGTGPYKFVRHDVGESIILERFDDYFQGPASIKNVEFRVISDDNTAAVALKSGDVDYLYRVPVTSIPGMESDPNFSVHYFDYASLFMVLMNCTAEPFDNVLVRQAINYAIDKDPIIQGVEEGYAKQADGAFGEMIFGHSADVKGYTYDIEKAKELLAQAGYPDGFTVTYLTLSAGPLRKSAEILQEQLSKIGITVEIDSREATSAITDLRNGNFQIATIQNAFPPDAENWKLLYASESGLNWSFYKNPKVDELFLSGAATTDTAERLAVYKEVAQLLNDEAVVAPLYWKVGVEIGKSDLQVGYIDTSGIPKVAEMSWTE
jgi:peptide/nickel transport system substrate-binding protein